MNRKLYAIWDNKAAAIVADVITLHRHDGTAVRMFTDALQGKGDLANHPADYDLRCYGEYDEEYDAIRRHNENVPLAKLLADNVPLDKHYRTVYTGEEWLEATRARPADAKPALSFPGMPASDR